MIIINFYLLKLMFIMLILVFYNREKVFEIYEDVVKKNYCFFLFGDSMFIK